MIREARTEDLPLMVVLGEKFYNASHGNSDIPFNRTDTLNTLLAMLESDDGILLVYEHDGRVVGMIAGVMFPWYFNVKHRSGQELFWYVAPEFRKSTAGVRLLKELEKKAKEKGATTFIMISEYDMYIRS